MFYSWSDDVSDNWPLCVNTYTYVGCVLEIQANYIVNSCTVVSDLLISFFCVWPASLYVWAFLQKTYHPIAMLLIFCTGIKSLASHMGSMTWTYHFSVYVVFKAHSDRSLRNGKIFLYVPGRVISSLSVVKTHTCAWEFWWTKQFWE